MKTVRMITTSASPERILQSGKVYRLPDKLADQLLTPWTSEGVPEWQDDKGKPTVKGGRAAWAELVKDGERPLPIPIQPDPGDTPDGAGDYEEI